MDNFWQWSRTEWESLEIPVAFLLIVTMLSFECWFDHDLWTFFWLCSRETGCCREGTFTDRSLFMIKLSRAQSSAEDFQVALNRYERRSELCTFHLYNRINTPRRHPDFHDSRGEAGWELGCAACLELVSRFYVFWPWISFYEIENLWYWQLAVQESVSFKTLKKDFENVKTLNIPVSFSEVIYVRVAVLRFALAKNWYFAQWIVTWMWLRCLFGCLMNAEKGLESVVPKLSCLFRCFFWRWQCGWGYRATLFGVITLKFQFFPFYIY